MNRDLDILDDVANRLLATDAFSQVFQSHPVKDAESAESGPTVWVQPLDWDEIDHTEDADGTEVTHHAHWQLTIAVQDEDPRERDRLLEQYANIALNALDGQALADLTIPGLTLVRKAKWEDPNPPERRLTLLGEFVYFVPTFDSHGIDL